MKNFISIRLGRNQLIAAILLVILIGFSCKNKTTNSKPTTENHKIDSCLFYINQGIDNSLHRENRILKINKAFDLALQIDVDTIRLKRLTKIQWMYSNLKDSFQFRAANRQARNLALKLNDSIRLGLAHWDLGEFLYLISVKDSAYYNYSKAQKIFIVLKQNERAGKISYDIGRIQAEIKDYSGSELNTVKAIELLKPLQKYYTIAQCYNLLGVVAKDLEENERSFQYYERANEYLKKSKTKGSLENQITNNIGVNFLEIGKPETAIIHFKAILKQDSLQYKYPYLYSKTLNNLAHCQYKIDPNAQVTSIFMKSIKIRDSIDDKAGLAGSYYNLAEYFLFKKDSINAIQNLLKSKDYAKLSSNNIRLLQSLNLLTQLDTKHAIKHFKKYSTLNDSLAHEEHVMRNKFARIRFETDEVFARNQMLERQKQLWAGISVSIMLLLTSGYVIINQRVKNQELRFQEAQRASDEKIFNLMLSEKQKLEEGKKIAQKRISEELHDGIIGKILGARMVLTGLNKKTDAESMTIRAEALTALKDVEGEVRTISHELSHASYTKIHNLISSISDLLQKFASPANINHTFNYSKEIDWDNLKGEIKINLYRIIQECITNVLKHSKCKNLALDFAVKDNQLEVLIIDDGIGYDQTKTKKKGIGMLNLQSRVEKLKGKWLIESEIGKGTTVKFTIPIGYYSVENDFKEALKF